MLSQAYPAALGFALPSCPEGMRGSSGMSTVLPRRVWPRLLLFVGSHWCPFCGNAASICAVLILLLEGERSVCRGGS